STGFIYFKLAKKYNIPIRIAHARNSNKDNIIKKYTTKMTRFYVTHKFAVSELAGISEFGSNSLKNNDIQIVPNAINVNKYVYNEITRKKYRKKLNIEKNFVVGHIGRFHEQKNHMFLLEVFKEIHSRDKNAKLILVGEGRLYQQIEAKI